MVGDPEEGWIVSSHSGPENNCVEVKGQLGVVLIRDSKARDAGVLGIPPASFVGLLDTLAAREA